MRKFKIFRLKIIVILESFGGGGGRGRSGIIRKG